MNDVHVYRISAEGAQVGYVISVNKQTASAYAFGKYGAGSDVSEVDYKNALDSMGLCVLAETRVVNLAMLRTSKSIRQLIP